MKEKKSFLHVPPEIELAYAAGFFDGEGSISIFRQSNSKLQNLFALEVSITNTNLPALEWMNLRFGGTIRRRRNHSVADKVFRPAWIWSVRSREARHFLKSVEHLLIVKFEEAGIAIAFQDRVSSGHFAGQRKMTTEESSIRQEFRDRLVALRRIPSMAYEPYGEKTKERPGCRKETGEWAGNDYKGDYAKARLQGVEA